MLIWPLCNLCPQVDSILDSIYVYRVHDYIEQIAVVTSLEKFLDEHPRVKLVGFPSPCCRPDGLDFSLPRIDDSVTANR